MVARRYAAYLSLFLLYPGYLLLNKTCFSPDVYFLKVDLPSGIVKFGALSNTDTTNLPNVAIPDIPPFNRNYFNILTGLMPWHLVLMGFFLLMLPTLFNFLFRFWRWDVYLTLVAVTFVHVFILFIYDLASWIYVERTLLEQGIHAELGNAVWYMFLVCLALLVSWCFGYFARNEMEDRWVKSLTETLEGLVKVVEEYQRRF